MTEPDRPTLSLALMFAGIAPFAAGALAALLGLSAAEPWFHTYGLVIGAFMAGTLWGRGRPAGPGESGAALIVSNVVALGLWVGAASTSGALFDLLLALAFLALLAGERAFAQALAYPPRYRAARTLVTTAVLACLALHGGAPLIRPVE